MIAFKCSGIEKFFTLVLETEGKKDSNSNEIHEKEENVRKLACFWLTLDCVTCHENLKRQMLNEKNKMQISKADFLPRLLKPVEQTFTIYGHGSGLQL